LCTFNNYACSRRPACALIRSMAAIFIMVLCSGAVHGDLAVHEFCHEYTNNSFGRRYWSTDIRMTDIRMTVRRPTPPRTAAERLEDVNQLDSSRGTVYNK